MDSHGVLVFVVLSVAGIGLAGCDDDIEGTWRLRDRPFTMEMTLDSGGSGNYSTNNPDFGQGTLVWADHGSPNGFYLDFTCSTACQDKEWRWTCNWADDGAELACSKPLSNDEYMFERD